MILVDFQIQEYKDVGDNILEPTDKSFGAKQRYDLKDLTFEQFCGKLLKAMKEEKDDRN